MKFLLTVVLVILTTTFFAHAQEGPAVFSPLLNSYYEIKNALVNSDAATAAARAADFIKAGKNIDMKTLPPDQLNAFTAIREKLISDADHLTTKDINKQRGHFANLSANIYALAKLVKLSEQPVYKAYCPMKKMYWLSNKKEIQNPYYGKIMLTCGSVVETIDP